jgi:hypothetical protein
MVLTEGSILIMKFKKGLFLILFHFFALNLFSQEQILSIIEFRSLTENDSVSKYVTNLLIQKLEELDSLSQISISRHQQPVIKENDYETLKPLIEKSGSDYLITGDININTNIISLTLFIFDVKNDIFNSTINIITNNDSTSIMQEIKKIAPMIINSPKYNNPVNLISLKNEKYPEHEGFLIFNSDVRKAQIFIDGEYIGETPFVKNVKYGSYDIKMVNPDYEISEKFEYNKLTNSNSVIYKSLKPAWLNIDVFPAQADIYIDDLYLGKGPILDTLYNSDFNKFQFEMDGYYDKNLPNQLLSYKKNYLNINLENKSKSKTILYSSLFPGIGQIYNDNTYRGILFCLGEIYCIVNSISFDRKMKKSKDTYESSFERYNRAKSIETIARERTIILAEYDNMKKYEKSRNNYIMAAAGIWLWNVVDALIWKEPSTRKDSKLSINFQNDGFITQKIGLSYEIR